jgi:hypothetical protein
MFGNAPAQSTLQPEERRLKGGWLVPTVLFAGILVSPFLVYFARTFFPLYLLLIGVWILVGFFYSRLSGAHNVSFTIWFAFVAILAWTIPMVTPHALAGGAAVSCGDWPKWNTWLSTWLTSGIPCDISMCNVFFRLDAFVLWEVAAIIQTMVFGLSVFFEMNSEQFRRLTVLVVLAIIVLPLWALLAIFMKWWHTQLVITCIFVLIIFVEDFILWRIECRKNKKKEVAHELHEQMFFQQLTFALDLPLIIATLSLAAAVWQYAGLQEARHFFAGAMAFSLIVANSGLIVYRNQLHWQDFLSNRQPYVFLPNKKLSLPEFIGWKKPFFVRLSKSVEKQLRKSYGIRVKMVDASVAALGDLDGKEIRIRREATSEQRLFLLLHLFGHTVQWNLDDRAFELGQLRNVPVEEELLESILAYEQEAIRYAVALAHEIRLDGIDQWLFDYAASDLAYLRDYYATGQKRNFQEFKKHDCPRIEGLTIPKFELKQRGFREGGVVV